jgi:pullulanase
MAQSSFNFEPVLRSLDSIEIAVNKPYDSPLAKEMRLYKDSRLVGALKFLSKSESKSTFIYLFGLEYEIIPGHLYEIADGKNEFAPLDISFLSTLPSFEEEYRYEGELGAIYAPQATTFRFFSPLASEGIVKLLKDGQVSYFPMHMLPSGVWEGTAAGDWDGAGYLYLARVNGRYVSTVDPYAKSVGMNSRVGYVVDMHKIEDIPLHEECLPPFSNPCLASVYEIDVRDMTSLTSLKDKGTFKALSQPGLKDGKGNPLGLDYIASLGVSHVQLMPVFDFQTIRDDDSRDSYNWGYDPIYWFSPEGSYATAPDEPYCRMRELRGLVSAFHQKGLRVNMDVVFNHTFQFVTSCLNVLCPRYYYRFNEEGVLAESSGCGNDIESRRFMMRKLILDCLKHYLVFYGMDGFRFDLMGILDKTTVSEAYFLLKGMKPSLLMYGEGWDMQTPIPSSEKASMNNAASLRDIGFFNDRFRDVVRGKSYGKEMSQQGYLTGDPDYIDGFKHVFLGSVASLAFPPLFTAPKQSVNYVECHDDGALWDKLDSCLPDESAEDHLKRIRLINACLVLSFGMPFIHAGQEVGHSKRGVTNSYNAGDLINGFDYAEAGERKEMASYLASVIALKKKYPCFQLNSKKAIMDRVSFENLANGALAVTYAATDEEPEMVLIINPSQATLKYQFSKYYKIVFNEAGLLSQDLYSQLLLVNGLSLIAALNTKED